MATSMMDHSHMDHSHMDHGNMGHGDMDMGGDQCSMNMLFTWSTKNLCIIFPQWRVTGTVSLLMSLVAVMLLTAGYEAVRDVTRRYELAHESRMSAFSSSASSDTARQEEGNSYLVIGRDSKLSAERKGKLVKAALYAVQVFYSFFIMLLFMTYNGWIMLAVAVGAFIGYLGFTANAPATKSVACH